MFDKTNIEDRAVELGEYVVNENATVRKAAKTFGISKSTVHKDISSRLKQINPSLYIEVSKVLKTNMAQRHLRGGNATKLKYLSIKKA